MKQQDYSIEYQAFKKWFDIKKQTKKYRYKLRAEVSRDVIEFLGIAHTDLTDFRMTRVNLFIPDVEFEFETHLSLTEVIQQLKRLIDGHVMYQTVKPINEYTGERNYSME